MSVDPSVMKQARSAILHAANDIAGTLAFTAIGGSHSYGLAHEESDIDIRGIYIANFDDFLCLRNIRDSYNYNNPDFVLYELNKFCNLAASANPNALEIVYGIKLGSNRIFEEIIYDNRDIFLSNFVKVTYGGYARQQLGRVERGEESGKLAPERRVKHLTHVFRLLEQAERILKEGTVDLQVQDKDRILELANSDDTNKLITEFENKIKRIDSLDSSLPDFPNMQMINDLILNVRYDSR